MRKSFAVLCILSFCLAACQNNNQSSGPELPVTPQNLAGSWEVVSVTSDGETVPQQQSGSDKIQYLISSTQFRVITSNEISVTSDLQVPYHLEGSHVVTEPGINETVYGFEVKSLTDRYMSVAPSGPSQPSDLQYNLQRIDESELAIHRFKPIPQHISYSISGPNLSIESDFDAVYPQATDSGKSIICDYRSDQGSFTLSMSQFEIQPNGSVRFSTQDPSLTISAQAKFDVNTDADQLHISSVRNNLILTGVYNQDGQAFNFAARSNCRLTLTRHQRKLQLQGTCDQVQASDPNSFQTIGSGRFQVSGECVLEYH